MTTHVEACIAEAEAAGWSGAALARLVIAPKSETLQGFRAQLAEANEIRGLIKIIEPSIQASGYDAEGHAIDGYDCEGLAEDLVAAGSTIDSVRSEACRILVERDDEAAIDTTPRTKNPSNVYAARAAEIDEHKGKSRG